MERKSDVDAGKKTIGFSALASLVTDISASTESSDSNNSSSKRNVNTRDARDGTQNTSSATQRADDTSNRETNSSRTTTSVPPITAGGHNQKPRNLWILGFVVVGILVAAIASENKQTSNATNNPNTGHEEPASPVPPVFQDPASQNQRPSEDTPPIGSGLLLTMPQLRYCRAEQIRLEAARYAVSEANVADLNGFNSMVDDYNKRCSDFKYHTGDLQQADSEVSPFRSDIESEGRARFSTQQPAVVTPEPTPNQDQPFDQYNPADQPNQTDPVGNQ